MRKLNIIIALLFTCLFYHAQNIDSLKLELKNATNDTTRCNILERLIESEYDDNIWPIYNDQLLKISESHVKDLKTTPNQIDKFYYSHFSNALNNSGYVQQSKGNFKNALEYFNRSIIIEKKIDDKFNLSMTYNNIAGIYADQKSYKNAIPFFMKSLALRIELNDKEGIGQSLANLATVFEEQGDTAKARIYFFKSLKVCQEINAIPRIAFIYNNLGKFYEKSNRNDLAVDYFKKSLEIQTKIKNKRGVCATLGNIAEIYIREGKINEAKLYAKKGFDLANELGFPSLIHLQANSLYTIESKKGNWQEALKYYIIYINMRDSVQSEENAKVVMKQQIQFEYEKQKAVDNATHQKELLVSNEREQKQKIISLSIGIGLILAFIFALFIYNRLRITSRQKKVIEDQKILVEEKSHIIEEKQKEVMDSIRYAQRIQKSLLPSEKYIERNLKQLKKNS